MIFATSMITLLAFDAVVGSMTLRLLEEMPKRSKVTVYGGLSLEAAQATPGHLIFDSKIVDGFWLTTWMAQNKFLQNLSIWRRAQKLISNELRTKVRGKYSLEDAQQAVKDYQGQMTGGKCLFVPLARYS